MQIVEVLGKELYRLIAVDHRPDSNDMTFLTTAVRNLKPHDFLEFKRTQAEVRSGNIRSRPAIEFVSRDKKILVLEATDHADYHVRKGFQEICLHITRGNPFQTLSHMKRGIYVYDSGYIKNDPRHHLNGPYVDICFEFCDFCFEAPLIDRMQVGIKTCNDCKELSPKQRQDIRKHQEMINSSYTKRFRTMFRQFNKLLKI